MIGEPGMLQSMGSQRVRHDLASEQQQQIKILRQRKKSSLSAKIRLRVLTLIFYDYLKVATIKTMKRGMGRP